MNVNDLFKASFGQFGSVYLTGDGALLDLEGASSSRYIIAITFLEDCSFEKMLTLDNLVGSITTSTDQDDLGGAFGGTTNESTSTNMDTITSSVTFPKGVTIYGKWDHVELNSGSCVCYLAPVGY
tara:strand:- start:13440 stop:13814 length:375 start_codon:yes stop_codon:yes gene_type:complete